MTKAKGETAFMFERNARLRLLRLKNGLSQKETAAKIGFNAQYFSRVERGMIDGSIEFWRNLKTVFHLSAFEVWAMIDNYAIDENEENEEKATKKGV